MSEIVNIYAIERGSNATGCLSFVYVVRNSSLINCAANLFVILFFIQLTYGFMQTESCKLKSRIEIEQCKA